MRCLGVRAMNPVNDDMDDLVFIGVAVLESCGNWDAGCAFVDVGASTARRFFGVFISAGSAPSTTDGSRPTTVPTLEVSDGVGERFSGELAKCKQRRKDQNSAAYLLKPSGPSRHGGWKRTRMFR